MKILNDIFIIKSHRESRALGAVLAQDRVLAQAIAQRQAAEVSLQEFHRFAQNREAELYAHLLNPPGRSIRVRDIQEVQAEVSVLRGRMQEFRGALDQAEDHQVRESQALEACKAQHLQAYRGQQKFVELVRLQAQEEALHRERAEEGEAEPEGASAPLPPDAGDAAGGIRG